MIKKEQFNNICPSTMEYSRTLGCMFTKILTILSLGRHCALSLWIWILARLESLAFPMLDLSQVFNLLSQVFNLLCVENDLSASQLTTGSVFYYFQHWVNKFGNIEGFISCKASSRFVGMALLQVVLVQYKFGPKE